MASFTSAVPGAPGSPDMVSAKVHPMPLSPGEDDVAVPKALAFEDGADVDASKLAVAEEGGGGGEKVENGLTRERRQTFDPDSEFFRNWDIFTTVLLIFTAVVTPFEVAFLETDIKKTGSLVLFIVNRFVDLGFIVDIGFTFFLPYMNAQGNPVKDLGQIARHYARGWLAIDIASILPFDTLTALSGSTDGPLAKLKSVRIIRLLRLMKLLRVLRGLRIFARLEARIEINYAMLSLQQFLVGLIMVAHWMACTFMMLHDMQWEDKGCDLLSRRESMYCTWLSSYEYNSYTATKNLDDAPVGVKYAICIYWAMGEITGVGDLPGPTNTAERLYLLAIQIFCVFLNAMIIGGVVSIIEAFNARKKEFHNSMDNLNTFLREKNLKSTDRDLCTRLRQYYLFKQYHGANDADIWEDVLTKVSPTLQGEVATGMHGSWMSTVPYFAGVDRKTGLPWTISERFKVQVALSITGQVYAPFEPIYREDDISSALMVVERGLAGCLGRLMRKGTSFGQDVFLNEEGDARRGHCANALTHTMVLSVPGETLHELLSLPENEHVRKQVRMRICRETMKSIALRIQKYLTLASNVDLSPFEAVQLMEREFGNGVFSKVPMMRSLWNERRAAAGDVYIKYVMVLQRAISSYKFRLGVEKAIRHGKVVRLMREAKHSLRTMISKAGLDPSDYVDKLVASRVTADMLPQMTATEITATGVLMGDAMQLVKAIKSR